MATESASDPPVVLLVEPSNARHHHAELLERAGFRVERLPPQDLGERQMRDLEPATVAIELDDGRAADALDLVTRLRANASPRAVPVPVIVYGHALSASDIEHAARRGAMWLQLEPSDGTKLVAAIRGVLSASGITRKET